VYRLDESPLAESINSQALKQVPSKKKIIATTSKKGLRETFKRTFLPLLIDTFELRQMVETAEVQKEMSPLFPTKEIAKTPREVLEKLQGMQKEVEEAKRWCDGVLLQIGKGIDEAKESLNIKKDEPPPSKHSLLKTLLFWKKR